MSTRLWYTGEEIVAGPRIAGVEEPYHVHFHFIPPQVGAGSNVTPSRQRSAAPIDGQAGHR